MMTHGKIKTKKNHVIKKSKNNDMYYYYIKKFEKHQD
jgi:hypothetical protein